MANIIISKKPTIFTSDAVNFDGTNDYYATDSDLDKVQDGQSWSVVIWFNPDVSGGIPFLIDGRDGAGNQYSVVLNNNGTGSIQIRADDTSNVTALDLESDGNRWQQDRWQCFLASIDITDTSKRHMYMGDTDILTAVQTYNTSAILNFTTEEHAVGAVAVTHGGNFNGSIGCVWSSFNEYINFDEEYNRRKFVTGDNRPVFLGRYGELPTNKQPDVYLASLYGGNTFSRNFGFGGPYDVIGGSPRKALFLPGVVPVSKQARQYLLVKVASQNIEGSLFEDPDTFFGGLLSSDIEGSLHTDEDILYHGQLDLNIEGSLFEDPDILYHGLITSSIFGSLHQDSDILYHGLVSPHNIFGSLLEDSDILYHGMINHGLLGSLLQDSDTFFGGFITLDIEGSFLDDENILYHGKFSIDIGGSLFQDPDILYHGVVSPVNLFGSLFEDPDIFYGGGFPGQLLGSLFIDDDTFFQGDISPQQMFGSLLEDTDVIYNGAVSPANLFGSLFQDIDIINGGIVRNVVIPDYRAIISDDIIPSNQERFELADHITLEKQGASARPSRFIGIEEKEGTI